MRVGKLWRQNRRFEVVWGIPWGSKRGLPSLLFGWCGRKPWKVCNFQNILLLLQIENHLLGLDVREGLKTLSMGKMAEEGNK